jgi:GNAT superfamily N-acetyltransferase
LSGPARDAAAAHAAQLGADRLVAGSVTRVEDPGGWLLRTPRFPHAWDLNRLVLDLGGTDVAGAARLVAEALPDVARPRVSFWLPRDEVHAPDGWDREDDLLMVVPDGRGPEADERVVEVSPASLRATRAARDGAPSPVELELADMQTAQAEAIGARAFAVREEGVTVAWVQVSAGAVDDLWVTEARRSSGLGRALLRAAVAAGAWWLLCDAADPVPQGLYRSEGFVEAGRVVQLTRR